MIMLVNHCHTALVGLANESLRISVGRGEGPC